MHGFTRRWAVLLTWAVVLLSPVAALAQYGATDGEWRSYGGDLGSTKYSPLDQIDKRRTSQRSPASPGGGSRSTGSSIWIG